MCALTRKALVEHAIQFKNPPRPPICVQGSRIGFSDVLTYDLSLPDETDPTLSEWGFVRKHSAEGRWLVPKEPVLDAWKDVDNYRLPPLNLNRRFSRISQAARVCGDRYRLAKFGLSGYSIYSALRGARWSSEDFLRDTDRFQEFMEKIVEFETSLLDHIARKGFHGVEFNDDWGPRKTSRLTLSLWRVVLRDMYAQQIKRAKDLGLQVWFATSDECVEFFGDLHQMGVDVVTVSSPGTLEVSALGRLHRSRVTFATRVDELYDPQDPEGSAVQIRNVRECLGVLTGGFIATIGATADDQKIRAIFDVVKEFKNA